MSSLNSRWAVQGERSNPLALWTITVIARHLGRGTGRALLYPIVGYFLVTLRKVRRHSREYLGRALGRPARLVDIARHLHCFASTLLDRVFLLTGRYEVLDVRVEGPDQLMQHVARGQGCLLLGSHLGSFEALRCLARAQPDLRVKVLMHRDQNPMMMRAVQALDPEFDRAIIDTGARQADVVLQIKQALDAGCCVGLLGDRVYPGERSTRCQFFGGVASFPTSPYLLASLLHAPLIFCLALYRGGNRYEVRLEELAANLHIRREAREAELQVWAQRYAARLEHYARMAPYNWFNFYDYWDTQDAATQRT